jgi:4'-phosphopantetheinyl transferase EntD
LQRLFAAWPAVAAQGARLPDHCPPLPAQEKQQIGHAVARRQIEFATARACARLAAARLALPPFILLNGPDRAPRWPDGVVGSLTHTGDAPGGYAAAAVALSRDMRAVGIDAEKSQPLPLRLWRLVLTSAEQMRLRNADPDHEGVHAKIVFSAKECFYKAQFPSTGRRLGFHDVEIDLDLDREQFQARPCGDAARNLPFPGCSGRFLLADGLVLTGIGLIR